MYGQNRCGAGGRGMTAAITTGNAGNRFDKEDTRV